VTSNDFQDWKRHPITQAVFSNLQERVDFLTAELVEQAASTDQRQLAERAGAIKAINDLLSISFGEVENGD
jgi:hypothetical protein